MARPWVRLLRPWRLERSHKPSPEQNVSDIIEFYLFHTIIIISIIIICVVLVQEKKG